MEIVFDTYDPEFLQDPYPLLNRIREERPIFSATTAESDRPVWFLTRHAEVQRALRDRRLGRLNQHTEDRQEWGMAPLRSDLEAFHDVERWSLVWGEGLVLGGGASEVEVVWAAEDEDGKTATFLVTPIVG